MASGSRVGPTKSTPESATKSRLRSVDTTPTSVTQCTPAPRSRTAMPFPSPLRHPCRRRKARRTNRVICAPTFSRRRSKLAGKSGGLASSPTSGDTQRAAATQSASSTCRSSWPSPSCTPKRSARCGMYGSGTVTAITNPSTFRPAWRSVPLARRAARPRSPLISASSSWKTSGRTTMTKKWCQWSPELASISSSTPPTDN